MEETLNQLGRILLQAVPTLVFVVFLNVYLKYMFFRPLEAVLQKRREATQGAKESAEASLARAAEKAASYEAALRDARINMYKELEETRRKWLDEQSAQIESARQKSHALIHEARKQIQADVVVARRDLTASSETLADQIAVSLLERRAS